MEKEEEIIINHIFRVVQAFDTEVFGEEKRVKRFCLAEEGNEALIRYTPSQKLAGKSGIPEICKSKAEEEDYTLFLLQVPTVLPLMIEAYRRDFKEYFPSVPLPDCQEVIAGIAAHEVRHRAQLHFRPEVFTGEDKKDEVIRFATFLCDSDRAPSGISEEARKLELDAIVVEIMVILELASKGSKVQKSTLVKIIKSGEKY